METVWTDGAGARAGVPGLAVGTWGAWRGEGDPRNGCGRTPGPQTVQRSELWAALVAARARSGPLLVVTDSSYVAKGVARLLSWAEAPDAVNGDLWAALRAAGGGAAVRARWVPAHQRCFYPPRLSAVDWRGNACADRLAGEALARFRPSAAEAGAWEWRLVAARGIARVAAAVRAAALEA